jgi:uncharacterized membrane protein
MMLALVWLHLVAAVVWIGGMIFLSLVLVPVLKQEPFAAQRGLVIKTAAGRFRAVVWGAVCVLLATGPLLALHRGLPLADPSAWPSIFSAKMALVTLLLALTAAHDVWLGPRLSRILQQPDASRSEHERRLIAWASWLPRISLLVALAVLASAVALARG